MSYGARGYQETVNELSLGRFFCKPEENGHPHSGTNSTSPFVMEGSTAQIIKPRLITQVQKVFGKHVYSQQAATVNAIMFKKKKSKLQNIVGQI